MERQAAIEYFSRLRERLEDHTKSRASPIWIAVASIVGYFVYGIAGIFFGGMLGLFFFVVVFQLEKNRIEALLTEFERHLYENTHIAEEGMEYFEAQKTFKENVRASLKPWWIPR